MAPDAAFAQDNEQARVHFERGNRLLAQAEGESGDARSATLAQALDEFVTSLGHVRSRNAIFNAGVISEELGRLDNAFDYYREYLTIGDLAPTDRTAGEARMTALRPRVAIIRVNSDPAGASVRVDRSDLAPRGVTPVEIAVTAGTHRLFLTLTGYEGAEATVDAVVGTSIEITESLTAEPVTVSIEIEGRGQVEVDGVTVEPGMVELAPGRHVARFTPEGGAPVERTFVVAPGEENPRVLLRPSAVGAARETGSLIVRSNVHSSFYVDNALVGEDISMEMELAEGPHSVRVEADGFSTFEQVVQVYPGTPTELQVNMGELGDGPGALPFIIGGGALALGVGAGVVGLMAMGAHDDYVADCIDSVCTNAAEQQQDGQNLALVADVLLGAAVVTALIAIVFLVSGDEEDIPSTGSLAFTPLPGGGLVAGELRLDLF